MESSLGSAIPSRQILEIISTIALQIQASSDLEPVLQTALAKTRQALAVDRVLVCRLLPDSHGVVWVQSVTPGWPAISEQFMQDPYFQRQVADDHLGDVQAIADTDTEPLPSHYLDFLTQLQVRASLTLPLKVLGHTWGLLIVHQCSGTHQWEPLEIQMLQQVAVHLSIAIQQDELQQQLQQTQHQLAFSRQHRALEAQKLEEQHHELQTLHQQLTFHIENTPLATIIWDAQFRVQRWSKRAEEIFGWSAAEVIGKTMHDWRFIYEEDQEWVNSKAQESFDKRWTLCHNRNYRKDGVVIDCEWYNSALLNESGSLISLLSLAHDVSDRKQIEEALRESENKYQTLFEILPIGIAITDAQGNLIEANPTTESLLGITCREDSDRTYDAPSWIIVRPDGTPMPTQEYANVRALREHRFVHGVEMGVMRPGGDTSWVSVSAAPIPLEKYGVAIAYVDITERKQAEVSLRQQAERERLIIQISQNVRQSLNLSQILQTTVTEVRHFLETDRVMIYRLKPDGKGLVVTESVGKHWQSLLGLQLSDADGVNHQSGFIQPGELKAVEDIYLSDLNTCDIELLSKMQVKAKLLVPILQGDRLWGLLIVHHCRSTRQWQALEIKLLQQLSVQVAVAIQQSEFYQQVQHLNSNLEQQVIERTVQLQTALDFEALLKRITDKVRDSLDEQQILQAAVQELTQGLAVECCNAGIYNSEQTISTIAYEATKGLAPAQGTNLTISETIHADVYPALLVGQVCQFCELEANAPRLDQPLMTILACPMIDDRGVLGDLWLFKQREQVFNEQEVRLVQQVANQCAIALRQSRLYQAAQAQVRELERLSQLKDDFLSTVSHELRTPMSNIKMATQMLEICLKSLGVFDNDAIAVSRYFQILKDECQREISLINDLLDLARLDAGTELLNWIAIDLRALIPYLTKPFIERMQNQQQQLELDLPSGLPTLVADRSYLERVLTELLNNACKYTTAGETIRVAALAIDSEIELRVTNSGTEIPETERDRVFDKFYRIPHNDPWKHGGTGLGLALVKKLVSCLGGTIHIESSPQDTSFVLRFPQAAGNG